MLRRLQLLGGIGVSLFLATTAGTAADGLQLRVLSSRPDMVTGGDALVRVDLLPGMSADDLKFTISGSNASAKVTADASGRFVTALVSGFKNGTNQLGAQGTVPGPRGGRLVTGSVIQVINHPITGPIFSGPQEQPFACMTDKFKLPGGGTLGPALDANCSIATRVDYTEVASPDTKAPMRVRIETGTINRGIYQIAMVEGRWNGRLIYTFGGGCEPGWYQQGDSTGGVTDPVMLALGYAVASNSLNVQGNNCGDVSNAETMAMTKEHFIEAYGVPAFTIGWGSSGGSTQQHAIAENYPGLLDGLMTGRSFADGTFASSTSSGEGRLFERYFDTLAPGQFTDAQVMAVTGFPVPNTIHNLSRVRAPRFSATEACPEELPKELRYDASKNPKGARCDMWDHNANVYGRDPKTGFARRPLDNVGIQYGLAALNAGTITVAQFLDINEKIGGFDIDGTMVAERMVADPIAIRAAYRTGRLNQAQGGLGDLPIIDYRTYYDDLPAGDVHMRFQTFTTDARLMKANGTTDNRVMLTQDRQYGDFRLASPQLREALAQMDAWLTALAKDTSSDSPIAKIRRAKPAGLVDACWTKDGQKIVEKQQFMAGKCHELYPSHTFPRFVAGAPISNDIVKCQLRPISVDDYSVKLSADDIARLKRMFPTGVCDWSRPGVEQQPLAGTWQVFNRDRGTN
jgi:hypothetical protein